MLRPIHVEASSLNAPHSPLLLATSSTAVLMIRETCEMDVDAEVEVATARIPSDEMKFQLQSAKNFGCTGVSPPISSYAITTPKRSRRQQHDFPLVFVPIPMAPIPRYLRGRRG